MTDDSHKNCQLRHESRDIKRARVKSANLILYDLSLYYRIRFMSKRSGSSQSTLDHIYEKKAKLCFN